MVLDWGWTAGGGDAGNELGGVVCCTATMSSDCAARLSAAMRATYRATWRWEVGDTASSSASAISSAEPNRRSGSLAHARTITASSSGGMSSTSWLAGATSTANAWRMM